MEGKILKLLKFNITTNSPLCFLNRFSRLANFDKKDFNFAYYFLELALIDYNMLSFTPKNLACSSIFLVQKLLNKKCWSPILVQEANYSER